MGTVASPSLKKLFLKKLFKLFFLVYRLFVCLSVTFIYLHIPYNDRFDVFLLKGFLHLSHNPIFFLFSDLQMWHSVRLSPESEGVTGVPADIAGFSVAASLVGSVGFRICLIASRKFFLTDKLSNFRTKGA